jgi:hypothetical protein
MDIHTRIKELEKQKIIIQNKNCNKCDKEERLYMINKEIERLKKLLK